MEIGAGSIAVSARPIFPTTVSISGMARMAMSCFWTMSKASPTPACGMVVGMNRNEPSSRLGMNSRPMPGNAW